MGHRPQWQSNLRLRHAAYYVDRPQGRRVGRRANIWTNQLCIDLTKYRLFRHANKIGDHANAQLLHHPAAVDLDGLFTVPRSPAICLLSRPATTWVSTSRSRGVRVAILVCINSVRIEAWRFLTSRASARSYRSEQILVTSPAWSGNRSRRLSWRARSSEYHPSR